MYFKGLHFPKKDHNNVENYVVECDCDDCGNDDEALRQYTGA